MSVMASQTTGLPILLNCLFRRRLNKTSKLSVTDLCEGNSPITGGFHSLRASNSKLFFPIWCRHHALLTYTLNSLQVWPISSHYDDVIMGAMASQITCFTIVHSTVISSADQSKHQSSASLAFVWGTHRGPVNSTHKWPVTRKMFPFADVVM